jgi:hypothetical protein
MSDAPTPPAASDLPDADPAAPPLVAWVQGFARIPEWHTEGRVALDFVRKYAPAIGLHVHVQRADPSAPDSDRPRRRRWTSRRVPYEDVADLVAASPGVRVEDVLERFYRTEPWTRFAQDAAYGKLRVALHHLGYGRVVRRVDREGAARLYPPDYVPSLSVAAPPLGLPAVLSAPATAAASRVLLRYLRLFARTGGTVDDLLVTDPSWFEAAAREVVGAARAGEAELRTAATPPEEPSP